MYAIERWVIYKMYPRDMTPYNNLGVIYDKLGKAKESIAQFQAATKADASFVDALFNLGLAQYKVGEHDAAIAAFEKVVKQKPEHRDAQLQLGDRPRRSL